MIKQYDKFLTSIRKENARIIGLSVREIDGMDIHEIEERMRIE